MGKSAPKGPPIRGQGLDEECQSLADFTFSVGDVGTSQIGHGQALTAEGGNLGRQILAVEELAVHPRELVGPAGELGGAFGMLVLAEEPARTGDMECATVFDDSEEVLAIENHIPPSIETA